MSRQFIYCGPVMEFDHCIANVWRGSTQAKSEEQARNNLTFQFKQQNNKLADTKITLPAKIYGK